MSHQGVGFCTEPRTCRRDASAATSIMKETWSICAGSDDNPVLVRSCGKPTNIRASRSAGHRLAGCPVLHRQVVAGAHGSGEVHRKPFEILERDVGQSDLVGGPQSHERRLASVECFLPAGST
jgi:hypothetical protein